jgi:alpha-L-fucosidase
MANGAVPEESVRTLEQVGAWIRTNGESIYGTDGGASISFGNYDNFTRKGNTLYIHVYFWPAGTPAAEWLSFYQPQTVVAIGGLQAKALSARVLKTGQHIQLTQDKTTLRLTGLPAAAPDDPTTVLAVECDAPPVVDHHSIRPLWPRYKVGVSG